MLKNKLLNAVSFMLAVIMVMWFVQMPAVMAEVPNLTVTDTTKDAPFFDIDGDMTTSGTNHEYSGSWYALNSELSQSGKTGYMVFSFDGRKTAIIDGVETVIKGTPLMIEFALLTYNWINQSGSLKYEMSADNVDWYTIKDNGGTSGYIKYEDADSALRDKYSDLNSLKCVTQSGANRNYYTITLPETFTDGNGNTVAPKYVRIGGTNVKGYCRVFAKPTITFKPPFSKFDVLNSNTIAAGRTVEIEFSEAMYEPSLIPQNFMVVSEDGNEITVASVDYDEQSKRAVITLETDMEQEKGYTLTASSDVYTADFAELTVKEDSFTTVGGKKSVMFVDDMSNSSYLTRVNTELSKNDPNFLEDGTLYRGKEGTASWEIAFDGINSVTQGGVTYVFDGVVKSLSYDYYNFSSYSYSKNVKVLASFDGVEYTALTKSNATGASGGAAMPGQSWVNYGTTTVSDIPVGTRYLKIEATGISSENNFLLGRITLEYESGVGDTYVRETEIDHYNEQTKIYLALFADADKNRITAGDFSIDGAVASNIEFSGTREMVISFDTVLEFDKEYVLDISENVANINGESLIGTSFKTYAQPEIVTVDNVQQVLNGTELKVSTNIGFNFKEDTPTLPITLFTVVYKDDKILSKSALDTQYINSSTAGSFENTVDINTSNGEYAVTFVLWGDNGFYPLDNTIVYSQNN